MTSLRPTCDVIVRWLSLLLLCVSLRMRQVTSAPVETQAQAMAYLQKYGYLNTASPPPGADSDAAPPIAGGSNLDSTVDPTTAAIKQFQSVAGIPETGLLDQDTLAMMSVSRCGVTDNPPALSAGQRRKKRFVLEGSSWSTNQLTYYFRNYTFHLDQSLVRNIVRKAIQMWTNASSLVITEASDSSSANIRLFYAQYGHGDSCPFDGPGGILAHAFYPDGGQLAGDAHFDDSETWTDGVPTGTNLLQVTTHELGHTLGLAHNMDPTSTAVMRPFYSGYNPNFQLTDDDIAGIVAIYGSANNPKLTVPTPPVALSTSLTTPAGSSNAKYCLNASIDAIVAIGSDTVVFMGNTYAMLDNTTGSGMTMRAGYPRMLAGDWPGLDDVTSIDAALYAQQTSTDVACLLLFQGSQYWRYSSWPQRQPDNGYPRLISDGFPGIPDDLDAAFVWSRNQHIYFIKGSLYYGYTRKRGLDPGYPRPLSLWPGLPANQPVTAAFTATDGRTYFFSGQYSYRFNDVTFKVDNTQATGHHWFGCSQQTDQLVESMQLYNVAAAQSSSRLRRDSSVAERNSAPGGVPSTLTNLIVVLLTFAAFTVQQLS